MDSKSLFEVCFIFRLTTNVISDATKSRNNCPIKVLFKYSTNASLQRYPVALSDFDKSVSMFCFPDIDDRDQLKSYLQCESYSFCCTNETGERLSGYCHRYFVSDSTDSRHIKHVECMCIVSKVAWFYAFDQIIYYCLVRRHLGLSQINQLITAFSMTKLASPGEEVHVYSDSFPAALCTYIDTECRDDNNLLINFNRATSGGSDKSERTVECYFNFRYNQNKGYFMENPMKLIIPRRDIRVLNDSSVTSLSETDYSILFHCLPVECLLTLFGALLGEARCVLVSKDLARLSSAGHALLSLLYPMIWAHIFIPILPAKLLDYISAPMPFLVGIRESFLLKAKNVHHEAILFVYLDENRIEITGGNSVSGVSGSVFSPREAPILYLPSDCMSKLESELYDVLRNKQSTHILDNSAIAMIFMAFFNEILGGCDKYIEQKNGLVSWNQEGFERSKSFGIRAFLAEFCRSQMYERFIEQKLDASRRLLGNEKNINVEASRTLTPRSRLSMSGVMNKTRQIAQVTKSKTTALTAKLREKLSPMKPSTTSSFPTSSPRPPLTTPTPAAPSKQISLENSFSLCEKDTPSSIDFYADDFSKSFDNFESETRFTESPKIPPLNVKSPSFVTSSSIDDFFS